ncbi:uncharacterized protein LOC133187258 isoform X2 [Saccostrea echinata]|uniref:uncharacterized protein LOC133187258 isoform X2 n=1 Tax=Saccostrea echinata TaxID=191078 RepID=UPI002A821BEC|nr:uncharacterized protein LOC133187258 isoform X2 [Saccostrea echinata]
MAKGSVPMRVRRRQSDAKWRASVATCYDTLKSIIPNSDKMSKRKISKAYVLQETEKHIQNLERTLQEILDQKVKMKNKAALYKTEQGLVEANVMDLKNHFSLKQQELYLQNYAQRKRSRCNVPSDMESGLVNMRSSLCDLMVLPAECLKTDLLQINVSQLDEAVVPTATSSEPQNSAKLEISNEMEKLPQKRDSSSHTTEGMSYNTESYLCNGLPMDQQTTMLLPRSDHDVPHHFFMTTPIKIPKYRAVPVHQILTEHFISPPPGIRTFCGRALDRTPSTERRGKSKTPTEKVIRKMQFDNKGFTPVKLPEPDDQGVPASPFTLICGKLCNEEEEGNLSLSDLLCTESIEQMDLEDEEDIPKQNQSTPNHRRSRVKQKDKDEKSRGRSRSISTDKQCSREKKCRRQLEKSFHEERNVEDAHSIEADSQKENDGYAMFCHHLDQEKFSVLAEDSYPVWNEVTEPDIYINMASLTNSQSDVSSWSSQEVHVSQSQDTSEVNQVVPGSSFFNHVDLIPTSLPVQVEFQSPKIKHEDPCNDTGFFAISDDSVINDPYMESAWESQVVPELNYLTPHDQQILF